MQLRVVDMNCQGAGLFSSEVLTTSVHLYVVDLLYAPVEQFRNMTLKAL